VRLLHREASELDRVLETGHHERAHDPVDGRLVVDGAELGGGGPRALDEPVEALVGTANWDV
jgi:hypothetical protein